ncbi:MAG TPA: acyl-CoA dehydrogenase family protein [Rhizomicrobium sp.]|nr:acyl-CoA dehydrogenase family protein [Rhizomicrobium sp.]
MDFSYSEEQTLLRNSLSRYLAENYTFEDWRKFTASPEGRDPGHWRQFAELGLFAAPLPEQFGGLGGGPLESMVVMEEFGRALVVEPFVPTVVIAGGLLAKSGGALAEEMLPRIATGDTIIAFAFAEPQGRYNLTDVTTAAKRDGDGYVLNGLKSVVLGAPWADQLIVTARTGGSRREEKGVSAFLVEKSAKGLSAQDYAAMSGLRASDIVFENTQARLIGEEGNAFASLSAVVDRAIAAHLAEALGAIGVLMSATVEYAKTRKQFGQPIGKFQVLQHRMVDMFIAEQQVRSASLMANLKLDDADGARAVSAAKAAVGKYAKQVGESAVQVHGGIGMTDELNVGHYFKRLTLLEMLYGSRDHHLRRMAAS